jgi:anti-anti-sigma factor
MPATTTDLFAVSQQGDVLVISPEIDLSEWNFQEIETGGAAVLDQFQHSGARHAVLDLSRTEAFGSSALDFFILLSKKVGGKKGQMALCSLSEFGREILGVVGLDRHWPICQSRDKALRLVQQFTIAA